MYRVFLALLVILSLLSVSSIAGFIQTTKADNAGTVYIRADGSFYPPTAPIFTEDNVTYTLTSNITSDTAGIVIERDNIILNGASHTLNKSQGGDYDGITLSNVTNVTVANLTVINFFDGIELNDSSNDVIADNNIINSICAIFLDSSSNNTLSGNNAINNGEGIFLLGSSGNSLLDNNATDNYAGIWLRYSSNNNTMYANIVTSDVNWGIFLDTSCSNNVIGFNIASNESIGIFVQSSSNNNILLGNNSTNNEIGLQLAFSDNNTLSENSFVGNSLGIDYEECAGDLIYHNNFINNNRKPKGKVLFSLSPHASQVYAFVSSGLWDDGYPSGGNYWSDYNGTDAYSGPYQNETGYDWVGDTPYVIDQNNTDRYPLMYPFVPDIDSIRIAYRSLLLDYNELHANFIILNTTYQRQLSDYSELQGNYTSLQNSYNNLQASFAFLNSSYSSLGGNFDSLNSSYINLKTTLNQYEQSTQNGLSCAKDSVYILTATTVVLIVATIYFAVRKPGTKPKATAGEEKRI
jgi:parallel beta-helix repeat protein